MRALCRLDFARDVPSSNSRIPGTGTILLPVPWAGLALKEVMVNHYPLCSCGLDEVGVSSPLAGRNLLSLFNDIRLGSSK
jgi:hypothetical protein